MGFEFLFFNTDRWREKYSRQTPVHIVRYVCLNPRNNSTIGDPRTPCLTIHILASAYDGKYSSVTAEHRYDFYMITTQGGPAIVYNR